MVTFSLGDLSNVCRFDAHPYEMLFFQHINACFGDDNQLASCSCYGRPLLQALLLPDLNTIPNNCVGENSLWLSGYGIGFSSRHPWFNSV